MDDWPLALLRPGDPARRYMGESGPPGPLAKVRRGRGSPAIEGRYPRFCGTVQQDPVQWQETQIVQPWLDLDDFLPGFRPLPFRRRNRVDEMRRNRWTLCVGISNGSTEWGGTGDWRKLAEKADVGDLVSYEHCLTGEVAGQRLEEDMKLGNALEVTATPPFFYRFGVHAGYANEEQLLELSERSR